MIAGDDAKRADSARVGDDTETHEAIVAGAGSAGLSAAARLQKRGFETLVLESSGAVGARWRSRYDELRLNSWRAMSNLQGYRMPGSCGRYPGRDDFVAYLDRYATHQRLRIRFHATLAKVERDGDLWRLETSAQPMLARYVVIATGWDAVPVIPDWPGRESFTPELIHSSGFHSARPYVGRDVLVVGAGNSGIDIAGHLIAAGARIKVSMRTPPNLARREILGLPGQPVALLADHLPARLADASFFLVQRMLFGDLTRFGIPRAPEGAYTNFYRRLRNPAIDDGFIAALKQGRAQIVAQVARFDGPEVVLADGRRLRPDAVICAKRGPVWDRLLREYYYVRVFADVAVERILAGYRRQRAAVYAPHTSRGFVAPPRMNLLLVSNGLLAKFGIWQAHRRGTASRLEQLAAEKANSAPGQQSCQSSQNDEGTGPRQMRWGETPRKGPRTTRSWTRPTGGLCRRLAMRS